ncbi:GyrI-like domain-containing protein [Cytobacillus sp. IB215316]|uniref:GyrI-like domain-containing protein n=1 Tax=Cytobacillus sp. IB215316 TaxID=3097354 RepID=UPI002A0C88E0|nr:GyrI-like domain-containing protein [Cytobacillus sp. IB215316]MDX8363021.1 GyrI-like domain-containing protein [Cytobacillus sp. IB215316]
MDKIDYKKVYSMLYKASAKKAAVVDIPTLQFIAIRGEGEPGSDLFTQSIQALYGIAYTISMSHANDDLQIPNFQRFVCPPLEGHWSTINGAEYDGVDQSVFEWELRIMMPEFVSEKYFEKARSIVSAKKNNPKFDEVALITRESKKHCVMMHIGSFDTEIKTFKTMETYVKENGYRRKSRDHEEIYLSDFRRVSSDKLKTVLAFEVGE